MTADSNELKVIIIGAGAAGLSAAYDLEKHGIDFEILEASNQIGGRMKINREFTDFPLPMGAEWLETKPAIFSKITGDIKTSQLIDIMDDEPDRRFVRYSWYQFFEEHILPSVKSRILFNSPVNAIDYSGPQIKVLTENGLKVADRVILSVPLKMLQNHQIQFTPPLPKQKRKRIKKAHIWEAYKAFIKVNKAFYQEGFENRMIEDSSGQKFFYDATYGQQSKEHIIGILATGISAAEYHQMGPENAIETITDELDQLFNGQVSENYITHIIQDWQSEPYIQGGYLSDYEHWKLVKGLRKPIESRIYFAGGAFTNGKDWVSVHAAAMSGKKAAQKLISQA